MSQPPPRDEPMLSAGLAGHLQRTAPTEGCPDAEMLAVYADGAATPAERTRLETHLASCLRCQAHLIALVDSAPPETATMPASVGGFVFPWKWLVPLATAAVLLFAVWANRSTPPPTADVRFTVPPPQAEPAPSAAPPAESPMAPPLPAPAPLADEAPRADRERARRQDFTRQEDARQAETTADTLAKAAPEASKERGEPSPKAEARAQAAPAPPPAAAAPQMSAGDRAGGMTALPSPAWRLVDGAVVRAGEADAAAPSGGFRPEGATLRAVAGVSPAVCWAVGDEGVVYRTTDGVQWTRLAFPERVRLVAVQAADETHAQVVAEDRRRFATDDGGTTWRALPSP